MWQLILTQWRPILLATALACLTVGMSIQTMRLSATQATLANERTAHDLTRKQFAQAAALAESRAREQERTFQQAQEKANERHQAVVEQAKAHAVKNFVARFGDPRHLGSGLRIMPAADSAGAGTPARDQGDDAAVGERVAAEGFVDACARDAGRLDIWRQWCIDSNCEVIE